MESGDRTQIGVIAPTAEALRRVCVEGVSGILATHPPSSRPTYEMSVGRITWPNGAQAGLYSAEEPDRLRGPNFDLLWLDEAAVYADVQKVWDLSQMALRLPGPTGKPAQCIITTTPRPSQWLKGVMASPDTVITRSSTMANAANLDAATLRHLQQRYAGTSLGRQELEAEVLAEAEGALWSRALLDRCRVAEAPKYLVRVVVSVDPSGGAKATNAECGIVVAGRDQDGHGYVLADVSARLSPERWAARAVAMYEQFKADRIVCEQNYGGQMVESTIRMVSRSTPVKMIQASRGKQQRAEPVCALYEQQRVHHVGVFAELEDQMCGWIPGQPGPSPDRLDAAVWALSELMVSGKAPMRIRPDAMERLAGIRPTWILS